MLLSRQMAETLKLPFEVFGAFLLAYFFVILEEKINMMETLAGYFAMRLEALKNISDSSDTKKGVALFFISIGLALFYQRKHISKNTSATSNILILSSSEVETLSKSDDASGNTSSGTAKSAARERLSALNKMCTSFIKSEESDTMQEFIEQMQVIKSEIKEMIKLMSEREAYLLRYQEQVNAYNQAIQQRNAGRNSYSRVLQSISGRVVGENQEADVPILREREITVSICQAMSELCALSPQLAASDTHDVSTMRRIMTEKEEHHNQVKEAVSLYLNQSEIFLRLNRERLPVSEQALVISSHVMR